MITLIFDNSIHIPKYEQLYKFIRMEIENGRLKADEKLPSKRKLATHLKISTVTVQTAYEQLVAEGYLRAVLKSGHFVQPLENSLRNRTFENTYDKVDKSVEKYKIINKYDSTPYISSSTGNYNANNSSSSSSSSSSRVSDGCYKYDFKTNVVDTNLFPFATWAKLAREVLSGQSNELLNITHPQGAYELRKEIANHLYNFRGVKADAEQIIVGAGSEYIIGLLIQLLERKSVYAIENPGYSKIFKTFQSNDVVTIPVSLDEHGLSMEDLRLTAANIVHTTPSHQFPSGIIMPVGRRKSLLHWANEMANRYIIEDDYDSEFRFSGQPIPALQGLDRSGKVIYINAFTKSLAPSFRISYMVLPPKLLEIYQSKFMFNSCSVSNFEQYILSKFMSRGHFERHLFRMRNAYKDRRDKLITAINRGKLKSIVEIVGYDAGLHILMKINNGMNENRLVDNAKSEGIRVYGLSEYYNLSLQTCPERTVVMGYSGFDSSNIDYAVNGLEKAWKI